MSVIWTVILLDTDLRRPSQHKLFGIQNRIGLTNLLLDENLALESALAETPVPGLMVLPSGPVGVGARGSVMAGGAMAPWSGGMGVRRAAQSRRPEFCLTMFKNC